jgi:hypothetical protein
MKNIIKKSNNIFTNFVCSVCFDIFDAEDYMYEIIKNKKAICYQCAEEDEARIIKRINSYINLLEKSRKKLARNKVIKIKNYE